MPYCAITDIAGAITQASVIQLTDDTYAGGSVISVTGASNAGPIQITTAAAHGLTTGKWVAIRDVLGNTAANGAWYMTLVDPTHFTLNNSAGSGAYTSGGTVIQMGDKVDAAILAADELINGFLRAGGYTLPLASTPPMILKVSVDISIYNLYDRRFSANMPESIAKKYDNAMKLLDKIGKRTVLIGADAAVEAPGGNYQTNKTSDDRVFTKDELDTY